MQVHIKGKRVRLDNSAIIGSGGEATVFRHGQQAVKMYLSPDPQREKKLTAMLSRTASLPDTVIAPQQPVCDDRGRTIGFTMPLLETDYREIRDLSKKKFRKQTGITTREIAQLFLRAGRTLRAIHQAGMVVGDLNDLNLMFRDDDVCFIDVDSFQFDVYPCMVGTEAFIDPDLYGYDLAARPRFKPRHDWYSFAVLLFKSLLLAHPYGGVHPSIKLLPQRAMQGISVFHPDVNYPRIAYSPDLLTDDLQVIFKDWFDRGKRDELLLDALTQYLSELATCSQCDATYPKNRPQCPECLAMAPVAVSKQMTGARTLVRTQGDIIAWSVRGNTARFIAHEDGQAVLYMVTSLSQTKRLELFKAIPTATYAFLDDLLVISPDPASDDLMIVDVSGTTVKPVAQTTTDRFGTSERVFGASPSALYRVANGYLMRGQMRYGQLVEQAVMAVADKQTWMQVAPDSDRVVGFFRTLNNYDYWLLNNQERIELDLPALELFEFMIDAQVIFAQGGLLILRQTQLNGVERIRIDEVSNSGKLRHTLISPDVAQFTPLDAHTFAPGMLLYATDKGVVRETLDTRATTTFTATEQMVYAGSRLFTYERGLMAVLDRAVIYLTV